MTWNLCSHLIRVWSGAAAPQDAVLEEISETHARFACEAAWARGARLAVESDGVGFAAEVVRVERRETDLLVEVRFLDGYRWSVAEWAPNHLAGPLDPSRNQRLD